MIPLYHSKILALTAVCLIAVTASVSANTIRPPRIDPTLPDPLKTNAGERITTAEEWIEILRPETLEHFRTNIYGRAPVGRPDDLRFEVKETNPAAMGGRATMKRVDIHFSGPGGEGKMDLVLFIPNHVLGPAPGFVLINHRDRSNTDPYRNTIREFWPAEEMVDRGYVAAAFHVSGLAPDYSGAYHIEVLRIFGPHEDPRPADAWMTIAAWAWGAARAMDYFEVDPDIDEARMAVIGHSRGGKAALWAGAEEERYGLTISNNSGSTGAAPARRRMGETVEEINNSFPHWFCGNYKQFNLREDQLPVDQHQLIALMAPRRVYVASANQDPRADPEGEFLSCLHASPVYELFGLKGPGVTTQPGIYTPLHDGHIAYHIRSGGHGLTALDWRRFMDYADLHWHANPWVRDDPWLGDHFVGYAPWIYSDLWERWLYLLPDTDSEAGAWTFLPKTVR